MKKLDLYLIKTFIGPFVAVFLIVVFSLSMQFVLQFMNELAGKGLGMRIIFEFMGFLKHLRKLRSQARHLLFKWLPVVFLLLNANITSRRKDIILLFDILNRCY